MITDTICYRLFATSPETLFLVLGMPDDMAKEMARRYEYEAIEFKETAHRSDGVFRPREPGLPLYFLEVQFYHLPSVFADLLVKAYTYLKQHNPGGPNAGYSRLIYAGDPSPSRMLVLPNHATRVSSA